MLPAADLSEILANLSALNLQPTTAAQILAAVLAPLIRPDPPVPPRQRAVRPRLRPRRAARDKRKRISRARKAAATENQRSGGGPSIETAAGKPTADRDAPRQRATAALKASPGASLTAVAELAKCSRSTVSNAARELAAEARKQARREARKARENPVLAKQTERRARAQQFLRGELAHGPKRVSDVEEAAEKAHIDVTTLTQARGDLGVVTSRGGNTGAGNTLSVQWSLPG